MGANMLIITVMLLNNTWIDRWHTLPQDTVNVYLLEHNGTLQCKCVQCTCMVHET